MTLWEFSDVEDLGSTRKGWYQPGLEARYQHDCAAPAGQVVSNRQPQAVTQASGINIEDHGAFSGHVDRYPAPIPSNLDPEQDGNACNPSNDPNACSWEEFVGWCKDELPENVTDPDAPSNDDIASGLEDTGDWGEDIGLQLWDSAQMCINGEVWHQWAQNANGSLDTLNCLYDDGQNQTTFACEDAATVLMEAFGCLNTNYSSQAQGLANVQVQYLFDPFGSGAAGYIWVHQVEQCFDQNYALEARCECSSDADCDTDQGETCNSNNFCQHSGGSLAECPVIGLAQEP